MWPFKTDRGELAARVTVLEAQVAAMRGEYLASQDRVQEAIKKMLARTGAREYMAEQAQEKDELREILGGVDVASILKDPNALQAALSNPAVINFALKKFGKELI